jgi:hypothetical protein
MGSCSDDEVEFVSQVNSSHAETAALLASITGSPKPTLPADAELRRAVTEMLRSADLESVTPRDVRNALEKRFCVSLQAKMGQLREMMRAFIEAAAGSDTEDSEEEDEDQDEDEDEEQEGSSEEDDEEEEEEWDGEDDGVQAANKKKKKKKKKAPTTKKTPSPSPGKQKKAGGSSPVVAAAGAAKGKVRPASATKKKPTAAATAAAAAPASAKAKAKATPAKAAGAAAAAKGKGVAKAAGGAAAVAKPPKGAPKSLVMAPLARRGATLLAQLRSPLDLSTEHGQVGQVKVLSRRSLSLSLKGENFVASLVPCATLMVVNCAGAEAKVEGCYNSYLMCAHTGNQFDAMDATVTGGSFDRSGFVEREQDVNRGRGDDDEEVGGGGDGAGSKRKKGGGGGASKAKKARK